MKRLFCIFQSGISNSFLFHELKGLSHKPHGQAQTAEEKVEENKKREKLGSYEAFREKEGFTKITGPTVILGDESSREMRMGINRHEGEADLGAGRIWSCHRKEIAEQGQTAAGFKEVIKKKLGFTIKTYSNAMLQIGKHDLLAGRKAEEIFSDIMDVCKLCDGYKMKVYLFTIPRFGEEGSPEDNERKKLNKMILESDETDQLTFRVVDLEEKMQNLESNDEDVYVENEKGEKVHRKAVAKSEKDLMTVAYLEALMGGGRDSLKVAEQAPGFCGAPKDIGYVALGDSYTQVNESYLRGAKKQTGHYIETPAFDPETEQELKRKPGENTSKMADRLETEVIPTLAKIAGYRCAVIQAGAEDIMRPMESEIDMRTTERAIITNLKRMYKRCLESDPPVMVVACTLPPMTKYIEAMYPDQESRERHLKLWKRINTFIVKETFRLSQNPDNRYKRIMCVRISDLVGTGKGYIRNRYRTAKGEISPEGRRVIASHIYYLMNWMRIGIDYGKTLFTRPKLDERGEPMKNKKGDIIFETIWKGPDDFEYQTVPPSHQVWKVLNP